MHTPDDDQGKEVMPTVPSISTSVRFTEDASPDASQPQSARLTPWNNVLQGLQISPNTAALSVEGNVSPVSPLKQYMHHLDRHVFHPSAPGSPLYEPMRLASAMSNQSHDDLVVASDTTDDESIKCTCPPAFQREEVIDFDLASSYHLPALAHAPEHDGSKVHLSDGALIPLQTFTHPTSSIICLQGAGNKCFAGTQQGVLHVYELVQFTLVDTINAHNGAILCIALAEHDTFVLTGGGDAQVKIWSTTTHECLYNIYAAPNSGDILCLAWSEATGKVFFGCQNTSIQWFNLSDAEKETDVACPADLINRDPHFFRLRAKSILPPAKSATVANTVDGRAKNVHLSTPAVQKQFLVRAPQCKNWAHSGYVYALLSTQHHLISAGGDGDVRFWRLPDLELTRTINVSDGCILCMKIHEGLLIIGTQSGGIRCIDLESNLVVKRLFVHKEDILGMVIGPDGALLSASADGSIRKWHDSLEKVRLSVKHGASVLCLSKSANFILSGGSDGKIKVWQQISHRIREKSRQSPLLVAKGAIDADGFLFFGPCFSKYMSLTHEVAFALIDALTTFVSFKSISGALDHAEESRRCARWLKKYFIEKGASFAKMIPNHNQKNPLVFANFLTSGMHPLLERDHILSPASPISETKRHDFLFDQQCQSQSIPSILIYAHYDVQPAPLKTAWSTNPWELTGENGYLYGRGVSDNKGPLLAMIQTVSHYLRQQHLPCNVSFLIDGEQECGSAHFEEVVQATRSFFPTPNVILASNSYWLDDEHPCLTYGLRGVLNVCLTVRMKEMPSADVHSGWEGGAVVEPLADVVRIMGALMAQSEAFPGFSDGITPATVEEEAQLRQVADACFASRASFVGQSHDAILENLQKRWCRPAISIHKVMSCSGLDHGVIPRSAMSMFSIRTVPNQSMATLKEKLHSHLQDLFGKESALSNSMEVDIKVGASHWQGDTKTIYYKHLSDAVEKTWRQKPLHIREGGSIAAIPILEKIFQAPVVHLPMGQASDAAHLPNERIRWLNLTKGQEVVGSFLKSVTSSAISI